MAGLTPALGWQRGAANPGTRVSVAGGAQVGPFGI